jgi:ligand-binding SRPBCC domain-containing protein
LTIALAGTPPWNLVYSATDASNNTITGTVSNILTTPILFQVTPAVTSTFKIEELTDANFTAASNQLSGTPKVVVNHVSSLIEANGVTEMCDGISTGLKVTLTGVSPWTITYTDGLTPYTVSNITTTPYSLTVSPSFNPIYPGGSIATSENNSMNLSPGIIFGTNPFTIEGWFRMSSAPIAGSGLLATKYQNGLSLVVNDLNDIGLDELMAYQYHFTVPTMSLNTWYHVVVVRDNSNNMTLFLNGTKQAQLDTLME